MGFAISVLPPSAAMVNAARQVLFTASGNFSNSLNAALIHEIGRVLPVIRQANPSFCHFAKGPSTDVVICDNICPAEVRTPCQSPFDQEARVVRRQPRRY